MSTSPGCLETKCPEPGTSTRWTIQLAGVALLLMVASPLTADDRVTLRTGVSGKGRTRLTGTIVDYTGQELRLLRNGREDRIPAGKVVRIETKRSAEQLQAERAYQRRDYSTAATLFRQAADKETRPWVNRGILARMARCYANLGKARLACESFRIVYRSDPTTQHLDAIPLVWRSDRPDAGLQQRAAEWLKADPDDARTAAARLMGASWLLQTAQRTDADRTLQALTDSDDERIAVLARAQRWRLQVVTATAGQVESWQQFLTRIPSPLRAGPYYLIGRTLARRGAHQDAALALMRVPILFPDHRRLAAESLLAAGSEFETMGKPADARRAYREVFVDFAGETLSQEARQRWEALRDKQRPAR